MKKKSVKQKKMKKVMKEFKEGKLHSGSKKGPVVSNPKKAVAIAYSEAKKASKKKDLQDPKPKKVTVAKDVKVARGKEEKMRSKPGSSNAGKYKSVAPKEFAGASGGASKYSYPINTKSRGRAALAYAHNAPNPEGIKSAVYRKYPALKKRKEKREGSK